MAPAGLWEKPYAKQSESLMIKANKKNGRGVEGGGKGEEDFAQGGVYREGLTRESFETRPGRCKK